MALVAAAAILTVSAPAFGDSPQTYQVNLGQPDGGAIAVSVSQPSNDPDTSIGLTSAGPDKDIPIGQTFKMKVNVDDLKPPDVSGSNLSVARPVFVRIGIQTLSSASAMKCDDVRTAAANLGFVHSNELDDFPRGVEGIHKAQDLWAIDPADVLTYLQDVLSLVTKDMIEPETAVSFVSALEAATSGPVCDETCKNTKMGGAIHDFVTAFQELKKSRNEQPTPAQQRTLDRLAKAQTVATGRSSLKNLEIFVPNAGKPGAGGGASSKSGKGGGTDNVSLVSVPRTNFFDETGIYCMIVYLTPDPAAPRSAGNPLSGPAAKARAAATPYAAYSILPAVIEKLKSRVPPPTVLPTFNAKNADEAETAYYVAGATYRNTVAQTRRNAANAFVKAQQVNSERRIAYNDIAFGDKHAAEAFLAARDADRTAGTLAGQAAYRPTMNVASEAYWASAAANSAVERAFDAVALNYPPLGPGAAVTINDPVVSGSGPANPLDIAGADPIVVLKAADATHAASEAATAAADAILAVANTLMDAANEDRNRAIDAWNDALAGTDEEAKAQAAIDEAEARVSQLNGFIAAATAASAAASGAVAALKSTSPAVDVQAAAIKVRAAAKDVSTAGVSVSTYLKQHATKLQIFEGLEPTTDARNVIGGGPGSSAPSFAESNLTANLVQVVYNCLNEQDADRKKNATNCAYYYFEAGGDGTSVASEVQEGLEAIGADVAINDVIDAVASVIEVLRDGKSIGGLSPLARQIFVAYSGSASAVSGADQTEVENILLAASLSPKTTELKVSMNANAWVFSYLAPVIGYSELTTMGRNIPGGETFWSLYTGIQVHFIPNPVEVPQWARCPARCDQEGLRGLGIDLAVTVPQTGFGLDKRFGPAFGLPGFLIGPSYTLLPYTSFSTGVVVMGVRHSDLPQEIPVWTTAWYIAADVQVNVIDLLKTVFTGTTTIKVSQSAN